MKALSPTGRLARRVVALDTDERILTHLRDIAVAEGVIIGLVRHDLRKPLPEDLQGQFDTVATDPAYTLPGLMLFLSRAIEAVKPEGGRIFLSFGHRPPAMRPGRPAVLDNYRLSFPIFNLTKVF